MRNLKGLVIAPGSKRRRKKIEFQMIINFQAVPGLERIGPAYRSKCP
jgi:hypothetical protein